MKAVSGRLLDFIVLPISCLHNFLVSNSMQQEIPWLIVTLYVPILDFWIQKRDPIRITKSSFLDIVWYPPYQVHTGATHAHIAYSNAWKNMTFLDDHSGQKCLLTDLLVLQSHLFPERLLLISWETSTYIILYILIPSFIIPYHPCILYLPGIYKYIIHGCYRFRGSLGWTRGKSRVWFQHP